LNDTFVRRTTDLEKT